MGLATPPVVPIDDIVIAIPSKHPIPASLSRDADGLKPSTEDTVKASRDKSNKGDTPFGMRFPVAESKMATPQLQKIRRFQSIPGTSRIFAPNSHNVAKAQK